MSDGTVQSKQAHSFHKTNLANPATVGEIDAATQPHAELAGNHVSTSPGQPVEKPSASTLNFGDSSAEAEIRRDYIYDEYAIIAPKRHNRPFDFRGNDHPLIETASSPHLDDQELIDSLQSPLGGWPVRVVANKFPAISLTTPKSYGSQELVVDTPLSNTPPGRLSPESMQDVLRVYQQRLHALSGLEHIKYVQVFKNDGHHAGASLAHAHTQIFALPIIPPRFAARAKVVDDYVTRKKSNPYQDIIAYETKQQQRIIADNASVLAFAPYASGWPLEAWLIPKRHMQSFSEATPKEIAEIAKSLLILLRKLNSSAINYNFFIEEGVSKNQSWVLRVYGRDVVSPLGGLEVATGIMINTIPPESAARWYATP